MAFIITVDLITEAGSPFVLQERFNTLPEARSWVSSQFDQTNSADFGQTLWNGDRCYNLKNIDIITVSEV